MWYFGKVFQAKLFENDNIYSREDKSQSLRISSGNWRKAFDWEIPTENIEVKEFEISLEL